MQAFRRLVALSVLVPDSLASGLSVARHHRIPWITMPNASPVDFIKVRLGVPVSMIIAALGSAQRRSVIDPDVAKWCTNYAA